jgi:hypothetical protein
MEQSQRKNTSEGVEKGVRPLAFAADATGIGKRYPVSTRESDPFFNTSERAPMGDPDTDIETRAC